jgi:hypothetical protein
MKKILLAAALALAATGAYADDTCKSKAVGSDGKPLAGAAYNSFMTRCKKDATAACTKDAADQKLKGAAKTSHIKKCTNDKVG